MKVIALLAVIELSRGSDLFKLKEGTSHELDVGFSLIQSSVMQSEYVIPRLLPLSYRY